MIVLFEFLGFVVLAWIVLNMIGFVLNYSEIKKQIKESSGGTVKNSAKSDDSGTPIKIEIVEQNNHCVILVFDATTNKFLGQVPCDENPLVMLAERYPSKKFAIIADQSMDWVKQNISLFKKNEKST